MRGAVRQRPFGSPAADLGDRQQVDTVILAVDHEGQVFMDGVVAVAAHGSALLAHHNSAHSSPPAFGAAARAGRNGLLANGFSVARRTAVLPSSRSCSAADLSGRWAALHIRSRRTRATPTH